MFPGVHCVPGTVLDTVFKQGICATSPLREVAGPPQRDFELGRIIKISSELGKETLRHT